jgi:hypothetical protein
MRFSWLMYYYNELGPMEEMRSGAS